MADEDQWITIGRIVAPQGLHGEVRINPSSEFPERFTKPGKRWIQATEKTPTEVELITGRQLPGKSLYVVKFAGINNRSSVQKLIGKNLLVPFCNRPTLAKGEFHYFDLIGLEVRLDKKEHLLGKVTDLQKAGNDLLEITLIEGKKILVPFVKTIVPEVHLNEGWIKITPPPGLLEL